MKTSYAGLSLIKHFEQCRLRAFKPIITDPWTIGWGRTKGVQAGNTCTQEEADQWLTEDVAGAEHDVTDAIHAPLTQHQFDALVSFTYNCGGGALRSSTLRDMADAGDITGAADQFLRWNKSKGMILAGLTRRREAERKLFLTQDEEKFIL